jgi:predicted DNA-binding transcriptional regulator AlpA
VKGPKPSDDGTDPADPRLSQVTAADLIGIADIAALAGVSRDTVDLWMARDKRGRIAALPMPRPLLPRKGDYTSLKMWVRAEIVTWLHATGRMENGKVTKQPSVTPPA